MSKVLWDTLAFPFFDLQRHAQEGGLVFLPCGQRPLEWLQKSRGTLLRRQPSLVTPRGNTYMTITTTALAIMAGMGNGVSRNDRLLGHKEKACGVGTGKCLLRISEWKNISQNLHASVPGPNSSQREGP